MTQLAESLPLSASPKWIEVFDPDDKQELVGELRQAFMVEGLPGFQRVMGEWRTTALALADPLNRELLLGHHDEGDYIEVERP